MILFDEAVETTVSSDVAHSLVVLHHIGELVSITRGDVQHTLKSWNSYTTVQAGEEAKI